MLHQHGGALQGLKINKSFMDLYDNAPGLVSVLLIYLYFMTYESRWIVICFIKYRHILTMFCTTCCLLFHQFYRHIYSDLEHMTEFFLNNSTWLIDCNFIICLLYAKSIDIYRISLTVFYYCIVHFYIVLCSIAFCQLVRINGLILLLFFTCLRWVKLTS